MSLNFIRSDVARTEGDIAALTKKLATETGKEGDAIRKRGEPPFMSRLPPSDGLDLGRSAARRLSVTKSISNFG